VDAPPEPPLLDAPLPDAPLPATLPLPKFELFGGPIAPELHPREERNHPQRAMSNAHSFSSPVEPASEEGFRCSW